MVEARGAAMVQRKLATYQDVLDAPAEVTAELIDGELFLSPQPRMRHQLAATSLNGLLWLPYALGRGGPGGWLFAYEPELHLVPEKRVLVPDLAGWKAQRAGAIDFDQVAVTVMPDWVCEVLSPSTSRLDRLRKLPLYAEHGVAWVWLVDPLARSIEIYRREPEGYLLLGAHGDDEKIRAAPFADLELPLGALWVPEPAANP